MWNKEEEEEILNDLELSDPVTPSDSQLDSVSMQSQALSRWVLLFLMFVRTTYKLSNTVISVLLRFFLVFLTVLGQFSTVASGIAHSLPSSLYMAHKRGNELKFRKYVVCRKCHNIYYMAQCLEGHGSTQISKRCSFQPFPLHPHRSMQSTCGTLLLKTVELAGGRTYLYPFLSYCYVGLDHSLQLLLDRPDFFNQCEQWRSRSPKDGMLYDVYNGKVWKDFQSYGGRSFLSEQLNFGLMMNVDFFQPYKHIRYSLGAIYVTIFNLPRGMRSKPENTVSWPDTRTS